MVARSMRTWMNNLIGLLIIAVILQGCSNLHKKDEGKFEYKEPEPPPLVKPKVTPNHKYLRMSKSGVLNSLNPERIAVASLADFSLETNPESYLNKKANEAKKMGAPFLPFHYYVAPDGNVFEGIESGYCGWLVGTRVPDSLLVGVLGDFDETTVFLKGEQETSLVQLLAWLCSENAIEPNDIVPITKINRNAQPLGKNLESWFGPSHTLRTRVDKTLDAAAQKKGEKEGFMSSFFGKEEKRDPPDFSDYM